MNTFRKPPYTPNDSEYDHPPPRWAVEVGLRLALTVRSVADEPEYRPHLAALENARAEARSPWFKKLGIFCGETRRFLICRGKS